MLTSLFSSFFSSDLPIPNAILSSDGLIKQSNEEFKYLISKDVNIKLNQILHIYTKDGMIFGEHQGKVWRLIYFKLFWSGYKVIFISCINDTPSIWNISSIALACIDNAGYFLHRNNTMKKYTVNLLKTDNICKFFANFDLSRLSLNENIIITGNWQINDTHTVSVRLHLIKYEDNFWLLHLDDRTEIDHINARLLSSQNLNILGQVTTGISHDFNNILTAIHGFCELLKSKLPQDLQSDLQEIINHTMHAEALTKQLLDFASSKKNIQHCSPAYVISNIKKLLTRLVGDNIELRIDAISSQMLVKVSNVNLERIIINLVTNSRDAIKDKGLIVVKLTQKYFQRMWHMGKWILRSGNYCVLSIKDNGCGIAQENIDNIFTSFFSTKEHGTGLGLSNISKIVQNAGGGIDIQSQIKVGTKISIYLPIILNEMTTHQINEENLTKNQNQLNDRIHDTNNHVTQQIKASILVVEDEQPVRNLVQKVLERHSYTVYVASNGQDALTILKENNINLIITDVTMPKMNGCDFIKAIKNDNNANNAKILVMSGWDESIILEKVGHKMNILLKPFSTNQLLNKVQSILQNTN